MDSLDIKSGHEQTIAWLERECAPLAWLGHIIWRILPKTAEGRKILFLLLIVSMGTLIACLYVACHTGF